MRRRREPGPDDPPKTAAVIEGKAVNPRRLLLHRGPPNCKAGMGGLARRWRLWRSWVRPLGG